MVIKTEWLVVVRCPRSKGKGTFSVNVEGADPQDQPMAKAMAQIVRVWLNATRRGQ